MTAIKSLVKGLIDYAGLFPPATLPLNHVADNYCRYLDSDRAWMLGRLVLPIARLSELEAITTFQNSWPRWKVSGLLSEFHAPNDDAFASAIRLLGDFNRRHQVEGTSETNGASEQQLVAIADENVGNEGVVGGTARGNVVKGGQGDEKRLPIHCGDINQTGFPNNCNDINAKELPNKGNGGDEKENQIEGEQAGNTAKGIIDAVEIKVASPEDIEAIACRLPNNLTAFFEIPNDAELPAFLLAIGRRQHCFAKIRTGGILQEMIPPSTEVARFIAACARAGVGFKATAGLHHPLRGQYRLTYDAEPDLGWMFGFINVFAAACFAFAGLDDVSVLCDVLCESDPSSFEFTDAMRWRGHLVSGQQIDHIRNTRAISFGSCSFDEPTSELLELGWLQASQSSRAV
jgi:hypothetical protein